MEVSTDAELLRCLNDEAQKKGPVGIVVHYAHPHPPSGRHTLTPKSASFVRLEGHRRSFTIQWGEDLVSIGIDQVSVSKGHQGDDVYVLNLKGALVHGDVGKPSYYQAV